VDEIIKNLGSEFCSFLGNIEGNEFAYRIGCFDSDGRFWIGFLIGVLLVSFLWGFLSIFIPWLR
tara:strand:- start:422 stop:613 length:192 start_codon:yes stop_codon:yes gene_type:complete